MADLSFQDKRYLERMFEMEGGYVLDFSNRTFHNFIYDSIKFNIEEEKYYSNGESKARRLRVFWDTESNYNVGLLIEKLLEYWLVQVNMGERKIDNLLERLHNECEKISERLKSDTIVSEIEVIKEVEDDRDFSLLAKSIRESINKNEPEVALDRLHTYVMKFIRQLCENHKIEVNKDESLNAIFGKYVKFIVASDKIESVMTERILKYSIHVIEAFNDIRNNRSFAHDNAILNYPESVLIFNNVTNSIKFIESIEKTIEIENQKVETESANWEDLPF
ncbi:abortive infection family protein [Cellulophaga sp. F20128]|uniref:abortive infection family protein n=1 Tax=Cellulophaga sp. F20128 TaxID=2926413 RepID=UPI001FF10D76|nr:abortive infection family protein [Cellulophaga sp. F20128]MCK0156020.1 abortive infection family protein [Cellulophaga sp. F20128]